MIESFQPDHIEFAQDVRTTCHRLNNFLTVLQCQRDFLAELTSNETHSEIAGILKDLDPLIESTTEDVHELSKKCRAFLEDS
ncbi:MAG: hypothetical protein QM501_06195 [Gimesia sp.]